MNGPDKAGKILVIDDENTYREVIVKDTGTGIKKEDLKRLFVECQQLDSGSGRRYQGTGLGLALTKKLVELMKSTVGVKSKAGEGSTFTIVLHAYSTEKYDFRRTI